MEVLSSYLASLVKPKRNFPGWLIILISLAFAGLGFVFFLQTETYLDLRAGPDQKWIQSHITVSQDKQDKLRKSVGATSVPEPFIDFNDNHKSQLIEARALLENDKDLQNLLKNRFGRNFERLDVVMVPMWSPKVLDNWDQAGITADARWTDVQDALHESDAKAVTVREHPRKPQMTLDGIPRIVVKDQAFASTTTLRKTVFHELLHSINLPGYRYKTMILGSEIDYTAAQDDLCYLPEYRQYIAKAKLWEYWECVPGAGSIAFGLFSLGGIIYLVVRSKFGW